MKKISLMLTLVMVALVSVTGQVAAQDDEKPVIVIVAFGSTLETGQANLGDFDVMVRRNARLTNIHQ